MLNEDRCKYKIYDFMNKKEDSGSLPFCVF